MTATLPAHGLPASLLDACPSLGARGGGCVLRLGHMPMLARLAPDALGEEAVPVRQVEWAAAILATDGREPPADPPPTLRGAAASAALADLRAAAATAFSAILPVTWGDADRTGPGKGLGWWLELYLFALSVLHLSRADALAFPLGELFALSAAHAAACGATFSAPSYAERDLLAALDSTPEAP